MKEDKTTSRDHEPTITAVTSGHTPGPWEVLGTRGHPLHLITCRDPRETLDEPVGPRFIVARTYFAPASEANAHLIAAAPELLEYVASSASAGCATAKILLAKATGEQR